MTPVEQIAIEKTECRYCGARPGERCRVRGLRSRTRSTSHVHSARWYDARADHFTETPDGWVRITVEEDHNE